jgi:hypothetical protein
MIALFVMMFDCSEKSRLSHPKILAVEWNFQNLRQMSGILIKGPQSRDKSAEIVAPCSRATCSQVGKRADEAS